MNKKNLVILFLFMGFVAFSQSKKEEKKAKKEKEYVAMKALVAAMELEFQAEWASPQGSQRVNVMTNTNYLRIKGDSIFTELPFFGRRTGGVSYNSVGGISIASTLKDVEVSYDDKKQRIEMRFDTEDAAGRVTMFVTLYGSGTTSVAVSSSSRSAITYDGNTEAYIEAPQEE